MTKSESVDEKPEIYFTAQDFSSIYRNYHYSPNQFSTPQRLLIAAKSCFFMGKYKQCIDTLKNLSLTVSKKILYQRQALMIKASYLNQPNNIQNIKKAYDDFMNNKNSSCRGYPFSQAQITSINELFAIASKRKQVMEKSSQINKQQLRKRIRKLQKQSKKFEGMYSFLVSRQWSDKFNEYMKKDARDDENPGPITNFQIINHIYEYQIHTIKSKAYMDLIMFPCKEDTHFHVTTRSHWNQLVKYFEGYPLQRMFIKDGRFRSNIIGDDTLIKIYVEYNQGNTIRPIILQWQMGTYWQRSVFPCMMAIFNKGQLKQQTKNGQYLVVQPGKIHQPQTKFKYIQVSHQEIRAINKDQNLRKQNIIMSFDMQKYNMQDSLNYGNVGLQNLGNTCYMNSALQCLSHLTQFSKYFIQNHYLSKLNLSQTNINGSFGQVTCALADIFKRLWFCSKETNYIDPKPFKRVFGERFQDFQGYQQQDAQQFLMFLLNCIHDDLNENSQIMMHRQSTTNRNFQEVRNNTLTYHKKHNKSIVSDKFHGFHSQTTVCDHCQHKVVKFQDLMMFHVQIPEDSPKLMLYFVPGLKLSEKSIRLYIDLNKMEKFAEVIEEIKKQFNISTQNMIKAFFVDANFKMEKQIEEQMDVKSVYNKSNFPRNSMIFAYEIRKQQKNQQIFLINYYYEGTRASFHEVDGFPRIIVAKSQIKDKDRQEQLWRTSIQTIPTAIYQRSKDRSIANISVKNAKGYLYQAVISIKTKQKISSFNFQSYNKKLGCQEEEIVSLQNCIKHMSQSEAISQQQAWRCQKCAQIRPAHKTDKLYKTGDILLIDLKRFTSHKKILTKVQYPVTGFDITSLVSDQSIKRVYNLKSVILHRGSLHAGHYTAYCQSQIDKKWYYYDDESVRQVDTERQSIIDGSAYILVYQRV